MSTVETKKYTQTTPNLDKDNKKCNINKRFFKTINSIIQIGELGIEVGFGMNQYLEKVYELLTQIETTKDIKNTSFNYSPTVDIAGDSDLVIFGPEALRAFWSELDEFFKTDSSVINTLVQSLTKIRNNKYEWNYLTIYLREIGVLDSKEKFIDCFNNLKMPEQTENVVYTLLISILRDTENQNVKGVNILSVNTFKKGDLRVEIKVSQKIKIAMFRQLVNRLPELNVNTVCDPKTAKMLLTQNAANIAAIINNAQKIEVINTCTHDSNRIIEAYLNTRVMQFESDIQNIVVVLKMASLTNEEIGKKIYINMLAWLMVEYKNQNDHQYISSIVEKLGCDSDDFNNAVEMINLLYEKELKITFDPTKNQATGEVTYAIDSGALELIISSNNLKNKNEIVNKLIIKALQNAGNWNYAWEEGYNILKKVGTQRFIGYIENLAREVEEKKIQLRGIGTYLTVGNKGFNNVMLVNTRKYPNSYSDKDVCDISKLIDKLIQDFGIMGANIAQNLNVPEINDIICHIAYKSVKPGEEETYKNVDFGSILTIEEANQNCSFNANNKSIQDKNPENIGNIGNIVKLDCSGVKSISDASLTKKGFIKEGMKVIGIVLAGTGALFLAFKCLEKKDYRPVKQIDRNEKAGCGVV